MIQVQHLTKMYGPRVAIDDLCFEVKAGEIVGFLGPNGAGKSTTMKILTGFMPATGGTAQIAGFDVFDRPLDVKRNVGYLPENPPVYLEMVVKDYLEFAAELHDVPKGSIATAVNLALEKTGLGDVRNRLIGNLSKGYRQRVGLAQALVHNPKVLILDEPTVGLDPKQIIEIRSLIKGLGGEHTLILSSHILPEITATCERVIVISRGKIVAQDTLSHLTTQTKEGLLYTMLFQHQNPTVIQSLKSIPGVGEVTTAGHELLIEVKPGSGDVRSQILETAVKGGLGVLEFRSKQISLEEVFLKLTSGEH